MSSWTGAQEHLLRKIYPNQTREQIEAALPTHSWEAIRIRARDRGIRRSPRIEPVVHPLIAQLYQKRMSFEWSQTKTAAKIGIERVTLNRMERGRVYPRFGVLEKWCRVLGFEMSLHIVSNETWKTGKTAPGEHIQESSAVAP
jgi:DNA-binding XRE family transcriptional regulator